MTVEEQMQAELQKQMGGEPTKVEPIIEKVEPIVEKVEPVIEKVEPVVEKVEPVIEKVEPIVPPVKSFEDYLAEKSGGKFNKWEDLETALTPKELKFANEKIKHFNDLAEKGIDVTSREFLELQSLDLSKITKADDVLFEKWKRSEDGEGLSEKTIRSEINKKYNVAEWIDKDEADLTDDDIANQEKMARDAGKAKDWITNYKNERVLEKQIDPAAKALAEEQQQTYQSNWEKFVDSDLVNKITKYTTPIYAKDGKTIESEFSFDISDQDRNEFGSIMKQLPVDTNAFFGQFIKKGADGTVTRDDAALFNMMVRAKNYDKAVALAYSDGAAKEALRIEKESKNSNFTPNEAVGAPKNFSVDKAMAEELNKRKF